MENLYLMSVRNPWACALLVGDETDEPGYYQVPGLKTGENRTQRMWESRQGRWTLLHTGKAKPQAMDVQAVEGLRGISLPAWGKAKRSMGAVVGAVRYGTCLTSFGAKRIEHHRDWANDSGFFFPVEERVLFAEADFLPYPGKVNLFWKSDAELHKRATALLEKAGVTL